MQIETDASTYIGMIPKRIENSNKGTYGKVLITAGCKGMSGAAFLSALAAYRTGAGLCKFLTAEENRSILQTLLPEAVFEAYDEKSDLEMTADANIKWADVIVLGPGLGTSGLSRRLLEETLKKIREQWTDSESIERKLPFLIIDADGLNILSLSDSIKKSLAEISGKIPVVITPHPMEMSRLSGKPVQDILETPEKTAADFSKDYGLITLLKGSSTVVSDKTGEYLFKNLRKSPALSKGGSGDVLSGTIAGIYTLLRASYRLNKTEKEGTLKPAYGYDDLAYKAVVLAALIHAEAGRKASEHFGVNGVLARDTADSLGTVIDELSADDFSIA